MSDIELKVLICDFCVIRMSGADWPEQEDGCQKATVATGLDAWTPPQDGNA